MNPSDEDMDFVLNQVAPVDLTYPIDDMVREIHVKLLLDGLRKMRAWRERFDLDCYWRFGDISQEIVPSIQLTDEQGSTIRNRLNFVDRSGDFHSCACYIKFRTLTRSSREHAFDFDGLDDPFADLFLAMSLGCVLTCYENGFLYFNSGNIYCRDRNGVHFASPDAIIPVIDI